MAFPSSTSRVLFAVLLLVALAAGGAGAANVLVVNNCPFTVWPGAFPPELGGGTQLNPGQTWLVPVPAGTKGARIWARTGCIFFNNNGRCVTGDCAGALRCEVSGKPPATLAEFTIGEDASNAMDYFDVSVVDGFNVPMDFVPSTGGAIRCRDPGSGCADGSHGGEARIHQCRGNSDYQVTFCP
ncbi:hypothetical protein PR202_ga11783 [Eleusine coracana subsp. coracana]|uniref:Thaumatin-like protein n=1 Tax=Eleusine coracana subsp. coracana TaxID=191504 RepID=A0AAV5CAD3_ELECO|nr:hypothetical protein PR202_ga11783 [Eleusine coracana subsp. coracana]